MIEASRDELIALFREIYVYKELFFILKPDTLCNLVCAVQVCIYFNLR